VSPLFDPPSHEPLSAGPWSEERVRAAIAAIAADAEQAFDPDALWPAHPLDEDGELLPPTVGCYLGASGVVWALDALARAGLATPGRDWAGVAAGLVERYREAPDLPDLTDGKPVPSLLCGESGVLLVAHRLSPEPWQVERMLECVSANARNPTRELMWGSPGTMLAAQLMFEHTGDERLAQAWRDSAGWLLDEWTEEIWLQELYGRRWHFLGPGHGFAGNVQVLARGDLVDSGQRADLEQRAIAVLVKHAQRDGDLAQWPPVLEPMEGQGPTRTQWCHGAPGIVTSFAEMAPTDATLNDLLVAGGELTWKAGPLAKGPSLCHGTAGNGYAFLKLLRRTGDERWLERARAFAMHAAGQVEQARGQYGRGRYTLWTGDAGVAVYLASCIAADPAMPMLDEF
jgi:Lanthionine synthetase C-like protein